MEEFHTLRQMQEAMISEFSRILFSKLNPAREEAKPPLTFSTARITRNRGGGELTLSR